MLPTLAFVLATGFTMNNGAVSTIVIPGIANQNECSKLALKLEHFPLVMKRIRRCGSNWRILGV